MKLSLLSAAIVGLVLTTQSCAVYVPPPYGYSHGYYRYPSYYGPRYGYRSYGYPGYYGYRPRPYGGWGGSFGWHGHWR